MCLRVWVRPLVLSVCFAQLSLAQTSQWAVVSQLAPGQKVKVETTDGKSHVGKVQSVSSDGIQIGKEQLIQKSEIQRVRLWNPGHHGRNALYGLGLGAGFGIAVGTSCGGKDYFFSKGACMAVAAPLFGGVGAAIGAVLPSSGSWHEVYRSK